MALCENCGEELVLKDGGKKGICPGCGRSFDLRTQEEKDELKAKELFEERELLKKTTWELINADEAEKAKLSAAAWLKTGDGEAYYAMAYLESGKFRKDPIPFYFSGESAPFCERMSTALKLASEADKKKIIEESEAFMEKLLLLETLRPLAVAKAQGKTLPPPSPDAYLAAESALKAAEEAFHKAEEEFPSLQQAVREAESALEEAKAVPEPKGLFKGGQRKARLRDIAKKDSALASANRAVKSNRKAQNAYANAREHYEEEKGKYERAAASHEAVKKAMADEEDFAFVERYFQYTDAEFKKIPALKERIAELEIYEKYSDPFKIYCELHAPKGGSEAGYRQQAHFYAKMNAPGGLADYYMWQRCTSIESQRRKLNECRLSLKRAMEFFEL